MEHKPVRMFLLGLCPILVFVGLAQSIAPGQAARGPEPGPRQTDRGQPSACNRLTFQRSISVTSVSGPVYFRAVDQPMRRLTAGQRISNTGFLLADAHGRVDLLIDSAGPLVRVEPREMLFVEKSLAGEIP